MPWKAKLWCTMCTCGEALVIPARFAVLPSLVELLVPVAQDELLELVEPCGAVAPVWTPVLVDGGWVPVPTDDPPQAANDACGAQSKAISAAAARTGAPACLIPIDEIVLAVMTCTPTCERQSRAASLAQRDREVTPAKPRPMRSSGA